MRVALLGAGHWHVPIFYFPALQAAPVGWRDHRAASPTMAISSSVNP